MSLVKKDWHQNMMAALELMREEVQRADKKIRMAHGYVDFWKVGKLNHNKAVEQSVVGRNSETTQPCRRNTMTANITSKKTCARQVEKDENWKYDD